MKRTKEWWSQFTKEERSYIVFFERYQDGSAGLGGGGYLPDDCGECSVCGNPVWLYSPCNSCIERYSKIMEKAEENL